MPVTLKTHPLELSTCNDDQNIVLNTYIGRAFIGIFQGGQNTFLRAYLGETSNAVIAKLPPEKQKTSTIKYTNFFFTFAVGTICISVGPGIY